MANMIPSVKGNYNFHNSNGEETVYKSLKKNLSPDYYVIHSVGWRDPDNPDHDRKGEADFLVFNPKYGFSSIEVKGGGVECTNGEWFSTGADGQRRRLNKSPMEQAWSSANALNTKIYNSNNQIAQRYKVKPIVWFTSLSNHQLGGIYNDSFASGNTFSMNDVKNPNSAMLRAYKYYEMERKDDVELSKQEIESMLTLFAADFNITPDIVTSVAAQNKAIFERLTQEQTSLLNFTRKIKHALVEGVGGTGKTMLALELARRIDENDKILFLCFNKFLLNSLRAKHSEEMPNVTFANLNELYAEWNNCGENAERAEIANFVKNQLVKEFKWQHIIIDEGQDLDADDLDELLKLAKRIDGYFYVFYDANQLVHQWDKKNLEWFQNCGLPPLQLDKNCRNTKSIAQTSYTPVGIDDVVYVKYADGEMPVLKAVEDAADIPQIIGETIRGFTDAGYNKNQIAILTIKTIPKSLLNGLKSIGGYRLSVDAPDGDGILFTTARKFKGLEAEAIIIVDFDANSFTDESSRNVFYVAASRAVNDLSIIANLDDDGMQKVLQDLGVSKKGSPRRLLAETLNVEIQKYEKTSQEDAPIFSDNNTPLPRYDNILLERVRNYGFDQHATDAMLAYYEQVETNEPLDKKAVRHFLRNALKYSTQLESMIVEITDFPFYDEYFALAFCLLLVFTVQKHYVAKSIDGIVNEAVTSAVSRETREKAIKVFQDLADAGTIVIESAKIGAGNKYVFNEE